MEHDATPYLPASTSLAALSKAARTCRGCPLWINTTQTVFGQGRRNAQLVLVGEQPGDHEDREGAPFVGPAGRVLRGILESAGIALDDVYMTNAVKHFKHDVRGKRRLHKKPNTAEIEACHPWLDAELNAVRARVVVALGATAARSLLGTTVAIAANRDNEFDLDGRTLVVTYHPSAVLRGDERGDEIRRAIIDDLRRAVRYAAT
jgi:uracil-DNA glycosylase family protein